MEEAQFLPDEERAHLLRNKRSMYLEKIAALLTNMHYSPFTVPHITFRKRGEGIDNAYVTTTSGVVMLSEEGILTVTVQDKAVGLDTVFLTEMVFIQDGQTFSEVPITEDPVEDSCDYFQRQNTMLFDVLAGLSDTDSENTHI